MRIGIFGGSFDPIHLGHLILAEQSREQAQLDQIWFMPCSLGPHKKTGTHGTDRQRIEMIELAIGGHESFTISKMEIERGGVSYTVDTLEQILESNPDDELFLLLGNDSLESFDSWREPGKICQMATPLVVGRPGSGPVNLSVLKKFVDEQRFAKFEEFRITSPLIEISSREIRRLVSTGNSIRYLTTRGVEKYIEVQKLFLTK